MARLSFGKRQPPSWRKLNERRKTLLRTMYLDIRLFGYTTEAAKSLAAQIRREKAA